MKILIDECLPAALKETLTALGHECETVRRAGYGSKKNGELLRQLADTSSAEAKLGAACMDFGPQNCGFRVDLVRKGRKGVSNCPDRAFPIE